MSRSGIDDRTVQVRLEGNRKQRCTVMALSARCAGSRVDTEAKVVKCLRQISQSRGIWQISHSRGIEPLAFCWCYQGPPSQVVSVRSHPVSY